MREAIIAGGLIACILLAVGKAETPRVYAIQGARIVTAAGPVISRGTVVLRDGFVEAVDAGVAAPPDARVIDGSGLTVYPGLIDMHHTTAAEVPLPEQPQNPRTLEDVERWKRSVLLRPQVQTAEHVKVDAADLTRLASAGITSVLAVPTGPVVQGHSALVNVIAPEETPQIGEVGDPRRGLLILRSPVALHVDFPRNLRQGNAYPVSLMGVIAFVRQAFLDAQHLQQATAHYERNRQAATPRPVRDAALEALRPAIARELPVAFQASEHREILRALRMAEELGLDPMITGALHADQATADLKTLNARVIYSLNYPTRPSSLAPDADEPLRDLQARANAPRVPLALEKAGVMFAFGSGGLQDPRDVVRHAARAVSAGLPADAAVRALTLNAARIAGAGDRLGSIERGKIANLIVTEGELFDEKMTIRHVFVDGRPVPLEDLSAPRQQRRRPAS